MRNICWVILFVLISGGASAQGLPQDVAEAYRAYETAVDGEDWAAAAYQAERAWRAAAAGDVDDATTTVLAANYGEVALINGNNAAAAEAYERAYDLASADADFELLGTYRVFAARARRMNGDFQLAISHAGEAIELFQLLPDGEAKYGGQYQANVVAAYASNAINRNRRAGRYAENALLSMSYFGPVSSPDVAQIAFLAGALLNQQGDRANALYYLLVSRISSSEFEMDTEFRETTYRLQGVVMQATNPNDFDGVYDRLRASGYVPPRCFYFNSCPETEELDPDIEYDAVPLLRTPPQYPEAAASRGQEGFVDVRFTVNAEGRVEDVEVANSTSSLFTRSALTAVRHWRYWPRRENGVDVPREGVQTRLDFSFED